MPTGDFPQVIHHNCTCPACCPGKWEINAALWRGYQSLCDRESVDGELTEYAETG